jgi:hypothetical protein
MTMFSAYQVAAPLLLVPERYTKGQRKRLREHLLNVLSNPDGFTPQLVDDLARLAVEP